MAKLKLLTSMLLFGSLCVFVRYIPLPSSVIALARGIIGTLFLLFLMLATKAKISGPAIRRNLPVLILSGAALGSNWILLFEAYRHTTVATSMLIYNMAPILVIAVSPFLLKERLTLSKILCIAASLLGMILVSGVFEERPAGSIAWAGLLLALGAAILYACIILLNKRLLKIPVYDKTIIQLGTASVVLLPYTLFTKTISVSLFSPQAVLLLLIVGIFHTGLAYTLYFSSITRLSGQTVAIFSYVEPGAAIVLSAIFLMEPMSPLHAAGAALILGSTILCEMYDGKKNDSLQMQ